MGGFKETDKENSEILRVILNKYSIMSNGKRNYCISSEKNVEVYGEIVAVS